MVFSHPRGRQPATTEATLGSGLLWHGRLGNAQGKKPCSDHWREYPHRLRSPLRLTLSGMMLSFCFQQSMYFLE